MSQITQAVEKREVEYLAFGSTEKIRLTMGMVRQYIAEPALNKETKELIHPSDRECMAFLMLCRARQLNPWERDCFMIPYWDGRSGTHKWNLITAHNAFLKRAEAHQQYDGMESGVIVEIDGNTKDIQGDFVPDTIDGEKVKLVGGWAKVIRKDRKIPTLRRAKLSTYAQNFGRWVSDPAGMIVKIAEADALRSTFPNTVGGMYLREEQTQAVDVETVAADRRPDFSETKAALPPVQKQDKKPAKQIVQPPKTAQDAPTPPEATGTSSEPETQQGEAGNENPPPSEPQRDPEGLNHSGRQGDMAETERENTETTPETEQGTPEREPEEEPLPPFKPRAGEDDALTSVRLMMHRNRIPEVALMSWARKNQLAKEGQFLANLSTAKIENINANFATILPKIKAMMAPPQQ